MKLPTLTSYEELLRQAQQDGWGYEQFLCEVLQKEVAQRIENQQNRRIKAARFPLVKSLDQFQFDNLPSVPEALVWQLATGEFVDRQENVIMIGNPGTGNYQRFLVMERN